jgi:hypothetical protein
MKWLHIFYCFIILPVAVVSQKNYWQQEVNFRLQATLNDEKHDVNGMAQIEYINHSPDTLGFIWFHLWPNAYKSDQTAFSEQMLINGRTDFYFSKDAQRGYINRLNFKVNGVTANTEDHPNYVDVVKLVLSTPLLPGGTINITTPFHVQLPENFSRGGHTGQSYQVSQWYPKPAVYDVKGWHPMPYLDQGEFYSEFGSYEVRITVPENYVVAATGELQEETEKQWLLTRNNFPVYKNSPVNEQRKSSSGGAQPIRPGKKLPVLLFPPSASKTKTITYKQDNIHDFAWFADKRYRVLQDKVQLPSGRTVTCYSYYLPEHDALWNKSIGYIKDAIVSHSRLVGEYPYNTVSVVEAKMGFYGGMEYPTITAISGKYDEKSLDLVISHELGHNWFYGILASNEREHPWMDEGMNSYYDSRYEQEKYPKPIKKKKQPIRLSFGTNETLQVLYATKKDQPIETPSYQFTASNYNFIAYSKTAKWLAAIEERMGRAAFDSMMQGYYRNWQFKHPSPEDVDAMLLKQDNGSIRDLVNSKSVPGKVPREKDILRPMMIIPAIGYNQYDGVMAGGLIHNYTNPVHKLRFLVAPLYGLRSKQINGIGRLAYNIYPDNRFYRIDLGVAAARFSKDFFEDTRSKVNMQFTKIAPFIRFTFKERNPLSQRIRYLQLKQYSIREDFLSFTHIETPGDTFDLAGKKTTNRQVSQVQWGISNIRALYPYKAVVQAEKVDDIFRTTLTAEEFFNYNDKDGGLNLRVFAGKIFYSGAKTITKQFANDRYAFNMTGPKGDEDYTFSDYFFGRNEFQKGAVRQIMVRDGAFKFRTDLLASRPGRTDNWMVAFNLISDIPNRVNPLSVLPIKLPVKLFLDLGTYAEAWKKNAQDNRFLFDAGIQLSLLKNTFNVYLPLLYSKTFADYSLQINGKRRSLKNVSFSLDLSNFGLRKLIPQFNF